MPDNYPCSTIKVPEGQTPLLIPLPCHPSLEVYSVINNHANLLFTVPPESDPISLDQSNRYRFIFFNQDSIANWQLNYKIIIKQGTQHKVLCHISEKGKGQKFYRNDIVFQYQ